MTTARLQDYAEIVGTDVIEQLYQLAKPLSGCRVVHVNSTRTGGGVAEILDRLVPMMQELGIVASWEVIEGNADFYACTKRFHNALQGQTVEIPDSLLENYEAVNDANAARLHDRLADADVVFVHDPQPVPLLRAFSERKGKWVWRCHIDVAAPYRPIWKYLRSFVTRYDASIWSLATFAQPLGHPQYLIPPSIDPLSEKNMALDQLEINAECARFEIGRDRPLIVQISRFDRFKDPIGVIRAWRMARTQIPGLQLVLAGSGASDDPEGDVVLHDVRQAAGNDPDIHILLLPPDAHRTINALQRAADIVLQKSVREGFGLTVTEAMWKHKPVIGGNTGGIRLQVINYHTGFLVGSPEGAALRIRQMLQNRTLLRQMGDKAFSFARDNFLITRHLRDYLTMILALTHNSTARIELA